MSPKLLATLLSAFLFSGVMNGQTPPTPAPQPQPKPEPPADPQPKPPFVLPIIKTDPVPAPKPTPPPEPQNPNAPILLTEGKTYVVKGNIENLIIPSVEGLVNIVPEKGPLRVRGDFIGGIGSAETVNFTEPFLYFIEIPAKKSATDERKAGPLELFIVPIGTKRVGDVGRVSLLVKPGDKDIPLPNPNPGPIPGPTPGPTPGPIPGPVPQPTERKLQIVVIEEDDVARISRGDYFTDAALIARIKEKGHYRPQVIDQKAMKTGPDGVAVPAPDAQPYIAEAKAFKLPRVFLIDPAVKANPNAVPPVVNVLYRGDLPDPAGLLELLKKHGG